VSRPENKPVAQRPVPDLRDHGMTVTQQKKRFPFGKRFFSVDFFPRYVRPN
jgi:hypothetical protein